MFFTTRKRFSAPGGSRTCVPIPINYQGAILAFKLKQISGVSVAATVNLYSSVLACDVDEGHSEQALADSTYLGDPDLYKICSTIIVIAGTLYERYSIHWSYRNVEHTIDDFQRLIYLMIEPQGDGDKEWAVSIDYIAGTTP